MVEDAEPVSEMSRFDKWKTEGVTAEDGLDAPVTESSFATLFPKYREKYIREVWSQIISSLTQYGIKGELNLVEGSMTVYTTRKVWDPYSILKARDFIKLIARSVPYPQAIKIMDDDMFSDIIKIGNIVRKKERFVKRRQRLIGPSGCTLKAIELITQCYVLVQGNTVACMGNWKDLKSVRKIVEDCMNNKHPIYNIKALMIKRELAKDEKLAHEDWSRFLPQFKKNNVQRKKPTIKKKGKYSPFPPAATPSKLDLELESGEYFKRKYDREGGSKNEAGEPVSHTESRQKKRMAKFIPPTESKNSEKKAKVDASETDVEALKKKLTKKARKPVKDVKEYIVADQ